MVAQYGGRDLRHVLGKLDRQRFRQPVVVAELPGDGLTHRRFRVLGEAHQDIRRHLLGGAGQFSRTELLGHLVGGIDAVGERWLIHQASDIGQ